MAEWIVDGNNVMGSRPDGWWRDRRGAQRRLVERLETFAAARDEPVTVIFDGRPHDAGGGCGSRCASRGARGRDAADDDVAALVARHPEPASLTRGDLRRARWPTRVRAAGGEVVGAGAFLRSARRRRVARARSASLGSGPCSSPSSSHPRPRAASSPIARGRGWATSRLRAACAWTRSPAGCRTRPSPTSLDSGVPDDGVWIVRRLRLRVERFPRMHEHVSVATWCSGAGEPRGRAAQHGARRRRRARRGRGAVGAPRSGRRAAAPDARGLRGRLRAVGGGAPRARAAAPPRRAAGGRPVGVRGAFAPPTSTSPTTSTTPSTGRRSRRTSSATAPASPSTRRSSTAPRPTSARPRIVRDGEHALDRRWQTAKCSPRWPLRVDRRSEPKLARGHSFWPCPIGADAQNEGELAHRVKVCQEPPGSRICSPSSSPSSPSSPPSSCSGATAWARTTSSSSPSCTCITGFGVTIGFHRLLTHRSFATSKPVEYLFAVLGSMSVQGPVISWVSDHRKHHAHADEEGDPHSPHVGGGAGPARPHPRPLGLAHQRAGPRAQAQVRRRPDGRPRHAARSTAPSRGSSSLGLALPARSPATSSPAGSPAP